MVLMRRVGRMVAHLTIMWQSRFEVNRSPDHGKVCQVLGCVNKVHRFKKARLPWPNFTTSLPEVLSSCVHVGAGLSIRDLMSVHRETCMAPVKLVMFLF